MYVDCKRGEPKEWVMNKEVVRFWKFMDEGMDMGKDEWIQINTRVKFSLQI